MTYDEGVAHCAASGSTLAAIYDTSELATARAAISAAGVEKAITSASSDGSGWAWHGTERWEEGGFPLNTGQVTDAREGEAGHIYSLHRSEDGFVWDADRRDERHRVLCRAFPPQPAGTTIEEKPAKQFKITVKFAGTVETFDTDNYEKGIRKILACEEPYCKVAIAVTAASVNVETTVTDTNTDTANNAVAKAAELKALTKEQLQTAIAAEVPGVVVESTADVSDPIDTTLIVAVPASPSSPPPASPLAPPPTDQTGVEDSDSKQSTNEALGAGLGLGLGLPVLCMFLFCLHVQLSFPAEMRGKYLKWRFSHTNPRCCGFMPKDRRDALWAEIKGNSSNRVSDRETAVEIAMPKAKAEDKKEVI